MMVILVILEIWMHKTERSMLGQAVELLRDGTITAPPLFMLRTTRTGQLFMSTYMTLSRFIHGRAGQSSGTEPQRAIMVLLLQTWAEAYSGLSAMLAISESLS